MGSQDAEDHLDWLRPVIDAPKPAMKQDEEERRHRQDGEERMLEAMHREAEDPDDHLDWLKR